MKFIIFLIFIFNFSFAKKHKVLYSTIDIYYKSYISTKDLKEKYYNKKLPPNCEPVTFNMLNNTKYIAKHYIVKYRPICTKDIQSYTKQTILFDFGSFEIEKNGEVLFENSDYVKIKQPNGKIEKIYKNGYTK